MTGIIKTDQIQGAQGTTVTVPTGNTLAVTSNATVGGTLGVTGNTTMSGTAAITGNTTVGGTLVNTGLITASAGVAVGGTGDANTLDDYEEGSWTPSVTGGLSYGFQRGHYVKVGKMVFASFDIDMDSIAASTNRLHGLPFSSAATTVPPFGVVHIGYYTAITTGVHWLSGYVQAGYASVYFTGNSQSGQTIQHNTFNVFNDTTRILGCITYVAA